MWINFEQKKVWDMQIQNCESISDDLELKWEILETRSFHATPLFAGISPDEFEANRIQIHEVPESSMLRRQFYNGIEDQSKQIV